MCTVAMMAVNVNWILEGGPTEAEFSQTTEASGGYVKNNRDPYSGELLPIPAATPPNRFISVVSVVTLNVHVDSFKLVNEFLKS